MDVIRFKNPTAPTKMESGEIINGLKSKLWVERYRQPGEFKFVANANSGIREKLPIGSFISHTNTWELMIVENHEVAVTEDGGAELSITGRSFETFLENRIIGSNQVFPTSAGIQDYDLPVDSIWGQAISLISNHILASALLDDNFAVPYVDVETNIGASGGIARSVKRDDLHKILMDLLAVADLGIKTIRPGWSAIPQQSQVNTTLLIHSGHGKKGQAVYSSDMGAIESSEYLWSNKPEKNSALVRGRWVEVMVNGAETEYSRRVMLVDGSDIDNDFQVPPVGANLAAVVASMQARGTAILAIKNDLALTKLQLSKNAANAVYRTDFEVGDLITILDDYHETSGMRITEYAEVEDENGETGTPTLELI